FDKATFADKLKEVMEYHNFQLVNFYKAEAVDYQKVLDDVMAIADILTSMVVDVSDLLDQARQRGEKVVMTNGIFDILHAGHVSYLANARKLGDRLIVAVNSDASTKRLKGEKRPVNALENRMIVLGAPEAGGWGGPPHRGFGGGGGRAHRRRATGPPGGWGRLAWKALFRRRETPRSPAGGREGGGGFRACPAAPHRPAIHRDPAVA
ncbi:adenylosuccinate synthetase, partial [Stenotrophomonas maltophilia]|uniref:adenylosuccinate synthetase n=1 Tax=Stenotrophomonas maltophilia TaxID=40324 RepID=UPI00225636CD|nr:adenylosuccinate synthetase [Stenotrophomonas maltophilia]